jgi:hypothetical protein
MISLFALIRHLMSQGASHGLRAAVVSLHY